MGGFRVTKKNEKPVKEIKDAGEEAEIEAPQKKKIKKLVKRRMRNLSGNRRQASDIFRFAGPQGVSFYPAASRQKSAEVEIKSQESCLDRL